MQKQPRYTVPLHTMLLMACDNNFVSAKECKQLQHIQNQLLSFMGKHLLIITDLGLCWLHCYILQHCLKRNILRVFTAVNTEILWLLWQLFWNYMRHHHVQWIHCDNGGWEYAKTRKEKEVTHSQNREITRNIFIKKEKKNLKSNNEWTNTEQACQSQRRCSSHVTGNFKKCKM